MAAISAAELEDLAHGNITAYSTEVDNKPAHEEDVEEDGGTLVQAGSAVNRMDNAAFLSTAMLFAGCAGFAAGGFAVWTIIHFRGVREHHKRPLLSS